MPSTAKPRRNRAVTRAALLAAARLRFAEHGYDGASVRDIAHDAGVDAALVFRYFGSKRASSPRRCEAAEFSTPSWPEQSIAESLATMLDDLAFRDWPQYRRRTSVDRPASVQQPPGGANPPVRGCDQRLPADAGLRLGDDDAELRAEILASLLLGIAVMRSVVGTPALTPSDLDDVAASCSTSLMFSAAADDPERVVVPPTEPSSPPLRAGLHQGVPGTPRSACRTLETRGAQPSTRGGP